jgi:hypothetical protein
MQRTPSAAISQQKSSRSAGCGLKATGVIGNRLRTEVIVEPELAREEPDRPRKQPPKSSDKPQQDHGCADEECAGEGEFNARHGR